MITVNELRYGCYVLWNGNICRVQGISWMADIDNKKTGYTVDLFLGGDLVQTPWVEDIQPLPLTTITLGLAGFYNKPRSSHQMFWIKGDLSIRKYADGTFRVKILRGLLTIESVHQLQNLYFILAGQELNIEL